MKKIIAVAVTVSIFVGGCATASKDITAAYVSPVTYNSFDCQQLTAEFTRIQSRVAQLGGRLDQAASNDKLIGVAGAILFWPALFALGGTRQQESEYARLKGEYEAVEQAMIGKKCALPAAQPSATVPVQSAEPAVASEPATSK